MKNESNRFTLMIVAAGLLGSASVALASDAYEAPLLVAETQSIHVASGNVFTDTSVSTSTAVEHFHGYSNRTADAGARGASSAEVTTTVTTERTLSCPGASRASCYSGSSLNPNTVLVSSVVVGTETSKVYLSGPGRSHTHR